jgi:hypothetical protein
MSGMVPQARLASAHRAIKASSVAVVFRIRIVLAVSPCGRDFAASDRSIVTLAASACMRCQCET